MKCEIIINESIDCEFSNDTIRWTISKLVSKDKNEFVDSSNNKWKHCRIRTNECLVWHGNTNECPLQDENAIITFRNKETVDSQFHEYDWNHDNTIHDIIAFTIII